MFTITEYTVEQIKDPYKIIEGERYEFLLDLEVDEEDELYQEEGVRLRVVYAKEGDNARIAKYEFLIAASGKYLDMEMEEDEEQAVFAFCKEALVELISE
ncbi:MAG: pullulanase [Paenibacillus sp.]|nr:pullulanase [Paenibacillus sp.]